jgi:hypothetical protein
LRLACGQAISNRALSSSPLMRFTKADILQEFDRQDCSYRLAIISSHWLQGGAQYKPSAIEEAQNLRMQAGNKWVSYTDLAGLLGKDPSRFLITTEFVLIPLHALIPECPCHC